MTDKKRIIYLDIARGIGMILVVMGHVEYVNITVRQFISAFHMPLFFLISGILIWEKQEEERSLTELTKRKLRGIMLPYAVFSLLSFCVEGGRIAVKGLEQWDVVFRQLFQSLCLQGVSTLWFLPALFMSELLFIGIRKKTKNNWTIAIIFVIVVIVAFLNILEKSVYQAHVGMLMWELMHDVISMLLRNLFCIGFVGGGYYIGKHALPGVFKQRGILVAWPVCCIIACVVIPINMGVDLR
ncbi:MAG: acyltransferase family protein [Lachnospiraceae bacterium]|nr:acyltransferase family protein [Lachnospiraceae bacterium]